MLSTIFLILLIAKAFGFTDISWWWVIFTWTIWATVEITYRLLD